MHPFNHILVGLELGPRGNSIGSGSRLALKEAITLARLNEARLTLLHSTAADEHWEADLEGFTYREAGLSEEGRSALQNAVAECRDAGIEAQLSLVEEKAWVEMIRAVQRDGHDLVIVGKLAGNQDHPHRLGSVSQKLLRKCPCPVWAVKPGVEPIPKNVVVGADRSTCGDNALKMAAQLCRAWEAQLHVVMALSVPMDVQMSGTREDYEKKMAEKHRADLLTLCTEAGLPAEQFHSHIGIAAPTTAIMACVTGHHADLLVMGSVGRQGVVGLLMGNTAERLLGNVDCSLLVVKPEDFVLPEEI
ncbi:MAG: universal stress protein [Phycisphaeraceae bacterium]|nr:universal stress protein [Phycisphaeraceae bacterium]